MVDISSIIDVDEIKYQIWGPCALQVLDMVDISIYVDGIKYHIFGTCAFLVLDMINISLIIDVDGI